MLSLPMAFEEHLQAAWAACLGAIVGIHGNSGHLFVLHVSGAASPRLELLDRITSAPSRGLGVADQFSVCRSPP